MKENRAIVPGKTEGFLSGCPFCTAHKIGIPEIGTHFRIISGFRIGATGTVISWPKNFPVLENEFMAQMDQDSPKVQSRVILTRELFEKLPSQPVPKWVPALSMKDASQLDKAIVYFCEKSFQNNNWSTDWNAFNEVVRIIWHYRLPLEGNELWLVLEAHGVPSQSKKKIVEFYERGSNLVIYCTYKKFRKKKKIQPLTA